MSNNAIKTTSPIIKYRNRLSSVAPLRRSVKEVEFAQDVSTARRQDREQFRTRDHRPRKKVISGSL